MHQESQTFSKDSDESCWKIWSKIEQQTSESWRLWTIQQSQINVRFNTKTEYQASANLWKIKATRELVRQSEVKRKQAPQSEANVRRHDDEHAISKKPPL